MTIQDSGERRQFDTGAVREITEEKGRCDLLPLDIVHEIFTHYSNMYDGSLQLLGNYIYTGDERQLTIAITNFAYRHMTDPATAMLEVSKQYAEGAKKYSDRNWEKGIPLHCYIDSAVRHYLKFLRGDTDEPHDRAFVWNLLGALWTQRHRPEMIDLPFGDGQTESGSNDPSSEN